MIAPTGSEGSRASSGRLELESNLQTWAMDSAGKKHPIRQAGPRQLSKTESKRVQQVKEMFEEWLQDSSGYDEGTWPELKQALNENHSKYHKLFGD